MKNYNWTINFLIKYNSIDQPINLTFNFVLDSKDEKIPASDNDDVLVEKHYKISDAEFSIQSNSSSSVQINYSTCNEYNEIITIGSKGLLENTNDNYDGN